MAKRRTSKPTICLPPDESVMQPASSDLSTSPAKEPPVDWTGAIPVLPYQWRWIHDDSQLKIAVWSRQSGKSFAAALRAVGKCLEKRTQYIILSKGERQSRVFMEKVKDFCQIFKEGNLLPEFDSMETEDKTMEVHFPHNGSRIIGLPANADAARGYSGNIVLDEFAFHGDARKIFAACFPIITRGYSIEVISTPNGTAGKFYEIAKAAGLVGEGVGNRELRVGKTSNSPLPTPNSQLWSGHRVDIYDAVAAGLPANVDLLRAGCDDEETWLQEYGCQFLSDAQNYISVELISSCVHEEATTEWEIGNRESGVGKEPYSQLPTPNSQLFLGVDIGRKRDLTVAWLFEQVGAILWSRRMLVLKGMSFDQQEKEICALIEGVGSRESGVGRTLQLPILYSQLTSSRRSPRVRRSIGHRHDAGRTSGATLRRDCRAGAIHRSAERTSGAHGEDGV